MTREAEGVPAGSEGLVFLPCLSGAMTPTWNGNARSVFHGLSMKHGLSHMTRAVFEGCTFGFRDIVDRFAEMGIESEEVRVVGGGAKSLVPNEGGRHGARAPRPKESRGHRHGAAMLAGVAEGTTPRWTRRRMGSWSWALPTNRTPAPRPPTTRHTPSTGRPTQHRARLLIAWRIPSVKAAGTAGGRPTDLAGLREALALRRPRREARPHRHEQDRDRRRSEPLARGRLGVRPWRPRSAAHRARYWTPRRWARMVTPRMRPRRLLAQQFEVRRVVLGEGRGAQLHADEEVLQKRELPCRAPTAWWWLDPAPSPTSARRLRWTGRRSWSCRARPRSTP